MGRFARLLRDARAKSLSTPQCVARRRSERPKFTRELQARGLRELACSGPTTTAADDAENWYVSLTEDAGDAPPTAGGPAAGGALNCLQHQPPPPHLAARPQPRRSVKLVDFVHDNQFAAFIKEDVADGSAPQAAGHGKGAQAPDPSDPLGQHTHCCSL